MAILSTLANIGRAAPASPPAEMAEGAVAPPAAAATPSADQVPSYRRQSAPVSTQYLKILWAPELADTESKNAKLSKKLQKEACRNLATAFQIGQGLWGMGVFDAAGCYLPGVKERLGGAPAPATGADWELSLAWHGKTMELTMVYKPKNQTVAKVTVPASRWTIDLLRDSLYAKTLAAQILDRMPAAFVLPIAPPKGDKGPGLNAFAESAPSDGRPDKLVAFTLRSLPSGLWLPSPAGVAKLSKASKGQIGWLLTVPSGSPKPPDNRLYAQRASGLGKGLDDLDDQLSARSDTLLRDPGSSGYRELRAGLTKSPRFVFLDNVAAGYVGFRYGYEQREAATAVLPPLISFGIVSEIRSGRFEGLRIYYDWVPRRSNAFEGDRLYLGWQRLVVGYGFGFDLPFFINRIEVAPKIGLWTVDSRMPFVDDQGNTQFGDFKMPLAPSVGVEACAEIERSSYLLRGWYSRDFSSSFLSKSPIKRQVNSSRYGVDAVLKGPKLRFIGKNYRLGFLLFYFSEDEIFTASSNNSTTFSLEDNTSFAGGGLAISW